MRAARALVVPVALACASCVSTEYAVGQPRSPVLRDLEGYAIASCLVSQSEPYLKDQGDGWASVIVQRTKGDLEALSAINEQVKEELAKGNMAIIRSESRSGDESLPLLYCGEIIDAPPVRAAIQKGVRTLASAYDDEPSPR